MTGSVQYSQGEATHKVAEVVNTQRKAYQSPNTNKAEAFEDDSLELHYIEDADFAVILNTTLTDQNAPGIPKTQGTALFFPLQDGHVSDLVMTGESRTDTPVQTVVLAPVLAKPEAFDGLIAHTISSRQLLEQAQADHTPDSKQQLFAQLSILEEQASLSLQSVAFSQNMEASQENGVSLPQLISGAQPVNSLEHKTALHSPLHGALVTGTHMSQGLTQAVEMAAAVRLQLSEGAGGSSFNAGQLGLSHGQGAEQVLVQAGRAQIVDGSVSQMNGESEAHTLEQQLSQNANTLMSSSTRDTEVMLEGDDTGTGVIKRSNASPPHSLGQITQHTAVATETAMAHQTKRGNAHLQRAVKLQMVPQPQGGPYVITPTTSGAVQQELLERFNPTGAAPMGPEALADSGPEVDFAQTDTGPTFGKKSGSANLQNGQSGGQGGGHDGARQGLRYDNAGRIEHSEQISEDELFELLEGEDLAEMIRTQQNTELRAKPQPQPASLARDVAYQLGHAIKYRSNGHTGEIRVRLNPAALGEVKIRLQLDQNQVRATIAVESEETLKLLSQDVKALLGAWKELGVEPHPDAVEFVLTEQPDEDSGSDGALADQGGNDKGSADPDSDQASNLHSHANRRSEPDSDSDLDDTELLNATLFVETGRVDVHI